MVQNRTSSEQLASLNAMITRVAQQRDKTAFAALFDHYAPLIRAYSLARDPGADLVADELTQEVMTRLWLKAKTFNPELANLNTWIYTLARNCRIDYLRKNSRHVSDIDPTDIFDQIPDENPGPFQLAHQSRLEDNIQSGLDRLPKEQSEILIKVYLEGNTHQEACEALRLPLGTVKSRLRLALNKLEVLVER